MSNPIKYTTGTETLALKKGNFYIGTGDVGKGPTSSTGYYNGITPPTGGYTVYLNKESGGPSIYTCTNDTQLISLTNSIAGQSYTTVNECLVYYAGQTDKVVLNRDYEGIVTDGLILNVDAGFTPSYPRSGTTWYDVSTNTNNGTLTNGPTFNSGNGGIISFDGINEYCRVPNYSIDDFPDESFTLRAIFKWDGGGGGGDGRNYLIQNDAAGGNIYSLSLEVNSRDYDPPRFATWNHTTGTSNHRNSTKEVEQDVWYDFVVTYERAGSHIIYVDGELISTWPAPSQALLPFSGGFNIGTHRYKNNRWFDGSIGLTQIYNRALSDAEVLQNYNSQKGRFGL
jgi:hypothetical protein